MQVVVPPQDPLNPPQQIAAIFQILFLPVIQLLRRENLEAIRGMASASVDLECLDPTFLTQSKRQGLAGSYPDKWAAEDAGKW